MDCHQFEKLKHDWIDGSVPEERGRMLEEHAAACKACAASLGTLQALRQLLGASAVEAVPDSARLRALGAILQAAAEAPGRTDVPLSGPPQIMDLAEVAAFLRVSEAKVRRILPDLPHFAVAGELRFRRESVERWIEREEQRAAAARLAGPVLTLVSDKGAPWALTG